MTCVINQRAVAVLALVCAASTGAASAATFQDVLVQAPSMGAPQRGSLAGTLSKLAFGPGDLARGTYALPLPVSLPDDRGPLLARVVPSYSPETGITEWGMGWQAELKIQRFQSRGEINFVNDEFTSPWGQLVRGDDGSYYPLGLSRVVRVTEDRGGWIAQTGDGTRYRFDRSDSVTTARGSFAWMLSRVDTILGDATTLVWSRNASGRPFLASVQWGGRGDGTQYQLRFTYEPVEHPFVSYLSGEPQVIDQRIARLAVAVKQGAGYATRWTYELSYLASPSGPAYYLQRIVKRYASGESDPPITYDYDLNTELWAQTQLTHTASLDEFIAANGGQAIQPDRATLMDLEEDGLLDLETAFDQTTVRQTAAGYRIEPLPAASAPTDPSCRPDPSFFNKPRRLARMHGSAAEPQVVVLERRGFGGSTRVLVCDRLGVPIFDQNVEDDWSLGANTRLVDVDLDKRPDIVRVGFGEISVLHNTSQGPQNLSFERGPVSALSPAILPAASWIVDMNGDGRPDLLVKHFNGVLVWLGRGGGLFESEAQSFDFISTFGGIVGGLTSYEFSFGDFNGDGLQDVLLTLGQSVRMFTNTGTEFRERTIPALEDISWTVRFPVIADLAGTGNEAAIFIDGDQSKSIQLTSPSTGLMRSADDGKGTVVRFEYGRAFGHPGLVHRYATLAGLTVASSGYDTVTYHYDYGTPVLHTLGKYLVGFSTVDKRSPLLTEQVSFLNADDFSGVRSGSADTDERSPGVIRFDRRQYADLRFRGVHWLRPTLVESGYRSPDGATVLSTTTQYALYEREFCPTVVVTRTPSGTLVTSTTLTSVPALPDDLHCVAEGEHLQGSHDNPALDFSYFASVARNELGQITRVTQMDAAGRPLVLQDVAYTADHRVASVSVPGRGTTQVSYGLAGQLASVTDPAGVIVQAASRDPLTDDLLALATVRPGAPSTGFFEYDGRERLRASWDDFSGSSQIQPAVAYAYQDATATTPGRIDTRTLADAITGTFRATVDLFGADGEPIVAGRWLGDHYSLGASAIHTRNTRLERHSFLGIVTSQALSAMTSSDLRELGTPVAEIAYAGFGHPTQATTTQQHDVVGTVTRELVLTGSELITRVHEPGGFTAESAVDAAGTPVRKTDETGVTHRYQHDALGRLVRVDTPDGAHTVTFDRFGRAAQITRDHVGAITYAYDATTGLPTQKQRLDVSGAVVDTSQMRYDAIGRPAQITRIGGTVVPGDTSELHFDYDGRFDGNTVPGQLGRLSRARGDGWARSELFDPLGRVYYQHIALAGWRDVTTDTTYRADGSVASDTVTIADSRGHEIFASTKETELDTLGRIATLKVDGAVLYTLSYDPEGRLARADFSSGEAITFDYDPVTHLRSGHLVDTPAVSGGVHWDRDPRGLIQDEVYHHGPTTTRRAYDYDGRGALIRSTSSNELARYTYTASGLPDTISDALGARSVRRGTSKQTVGDTTYTWDAAGRVAAKGDWIFDYGAHGQLARARRPGRQIEFVYDDGDRRLLKRVDGVPVRAEVAGGVLTEKHFIELVTIGEVVAGVLDNGKFVPLLTDPRGTPFVDSSGAPGLASPYGVRASHLAYADVIDYARLGWDPDLDIVRMGARDYDAKLSQFLTPDPLYFEDLDRCQDSPLQCSLYGYAGGNPISFVDPTGLGVRETLLSAGAAWFGFSLGVADALTFGFVSNHAYDQEDVQKWHQVTEFHVGHVGGEITASSALMAAGVFQLQAAAAGGALVFTTGSVVVTSSAATNVVLATGALALGTMGGAHLLSEMKDDGSGCQCTKVDQSGSTPSEGSRPPNMSPDGAGRTGAFKEAKRQSGVPTSQQPSRVTPNVDKRGNPQSGRIYEYDRGPGEEPVRIRDDADGHYYGKDDPQNRGPHFNDAAGNHYDY